MSGISDFITVHVRVIDFGIRIFARHFAYHSPDLLYICSVINARNICAPGFSFSCFYGAPGFGPDDSVVFNVSSSWVDIQFSLCFLRHLMTSLRSSLSQIVLCFAILDLLLGIVLFAMLQRASVKLLTGSAALIIQSAFRSEEAFSEKVSQSALLSFQVLLVTDGEALLECIIIIGK